ncbi:peptidase M48, Ste24p [Sphingopyxis lindanitolerans]|uniref:Peptidase M48, Ste24p n=1 Tax=Sphingopyxis lindanitolerans TaxID=2054227 RepID=A0A2S8B7C7_9SPHN|nr:M48 family metallopeptidase [Sphingopyxis lindanitolerans]PQM28257.1 peptidase M48, Ste24p [Sphingopyxis lindanitolerans]
MRPLLILAPILLGFLLPPAAIASIAGPSPYAELAALEARVAAIGFRLTTANAAWCPAVQPQFGWIWGDPRLYDGARRAEALAAYHAADIDAPFIAAIAPGSPADRAGLHVGAPVLTIDGTAVPASEDADPFARIAAVEARFAALPPRAAAKISGAAGPAVAITPVPGCASDFRVDARDRPEGAADGRLVVVSGGLVRFAASDDELAAAVAHELAHNILHHRARLDAAGVDRGLGKQFGRNARLFKQTEIEADRLSAWLLAGAGYDPHAAIRFWTRFGQREGRPLFQAGTHPRWRDRVASIATEVRAIDAARAAGRPLEPPLIADPPPLE